MNTDVRVRRRQTGRAMHWEGVWERQPKMRETVQTYLEWLLLGKMGKRRSWNTAQTAKYALATIATIVEQGGKTSFAELIPAMLQKWWKTVKHNEGNRAIIEYAMRMCACRGLPHLPTNPLAGMRIANFVVTDKITQTETIDDECWRIILHRALSLEAEAFQFARWRETRDYADPWAVKNRITCRRAETRLLWKFRMAGAILVLAFTGMRRSELCALRTGALECIQRGTPVWVIWSTVFKFYGEGERARWVCGEIGRRGYLMLSALAESDGSLFRKYTLCMLPNNLTRCFDFQGPGEDANALSIHPHQFRRTLAQLLFVEDDITLVAIKAQFKHRTTAMTEYYVGKDGSLIAKCLAKEPLLAMSLSELRKEAGTDE